eukprot:CAMPEP_0175150502 /NCGR_PEP_ID=MMETSP0087-20121206/17927_1 /TAXON_ID=136419 /ORGANISM="Unknown Unknown, Strain D1" /LENGTH=284 /DNA_ID=CAMNT_0016436497 /DNA_START=35 /DNA_END=889 /DNA_ORIENTATION=-
MRLFVCLLVSLLVLAQKYSPTDAKLYVKYAAATYCCGTLGQGCKEWDCAVCKQLPHLSTIPIYNETNNMHGYVGYDNSTDSIIVAVAGTSPLSIRNWIADIDIVQKPFPACDGCRVHKGFMDAFDSFQPQMEVAIQAFLTEHPTAHVHVTGHSLGAAVAAHVTVYIATQLPKVQLRSTYMFGLPRVGNKAFADYIAATVRSRQLVFFHVTHHRDPVPHLPWEDAGFHHPPTEVYYDEPNAEYRVCDGSGEDPRCADQFDVTLDVFDHLTYLNFSFTENYLGCIL